MFGGRGFGGTYFGQAGCASPVPTAPGGGVGGSGFPADWFTRMGLEKPDDDDLAMLVALGLIR